LGVVSNQTGSNTVETAKTDRYGNVYLPVIAGKIADFNEILAGQILKFIFGPDHRPKIGQIRKILGLGSFA
jgi:hypothetical protein